MKKVLLGLLVLVSTMFLMACNLKETKQYFATLDQIPSNGWTYYVVVKTKGGEITEVIWDAYNIKGDAYVAADAPTPATAMTKYQASVAGLYNMSTGLKWHEQADLITKNLIKTQDINARIPVPAGATITTEDFYTLVEKALASNPIPKGNYVDGYHFISNKNVNPVQKSAVRYWDPVKLEVVELAGYLQYTFAEYIVVNGSIAFAYFNTVNHGYKAAMDETNKIQKHAWDDDNNPETPAKNLTIIAPYTTAKPAVINTKNELGLSYGMKKPNGGNNYEYVEISKFAADYLVENQAFPALNADGKFDDVANVTITTSDYVALTEKLPKK